MLKNMAMMLASVCVAAYLGYLVTPHIVGWLQ